MGCRFSGVIVVIMFYCDRQKLKMLDTLICIISGWGFLFVISYFTFIYFYFYAFTLTYYTLLLILEKIKNGRPKTLKGLPRMQRKFVGGSFSSRIIVIWDSVVQAYLGSCGIWRERVGD